MNNWNIGDSQQIRIANLSWEICILCGSRPRRLKAGPKKKALQTTPPRSRFTTRQRLSSMRKQEEKPPRRILAWSLIREVEECAAGSGGLRDRGLPGRGTKAVRLLLSPRTSFDEHVNDGFPRWNSDPVTRRERHYNPCRRTISNRPTIADCRAATNKIRRTIFLDVLS